jgi:hypothetical protein
MTKSPLFSALLVLFSLYLASCSGESAPQRIAAHGTVKLDGELLQKGQIRFIPSGDTSGPSAAAPIVDGKYLFTEDDGPIVGTNRIEIEATDYLGFAMDDEQAFAKFAESGGTRDKKRTQNPVPEHYNRHSTLVRTIDADKQPLFDFNLEPVTAAQTSVKK